MTIDIDMSFSQQEIEETCAEAAHEMNRILCEAHGEALPRNPLVIQNPPR